MKLTDKEKAVLKKVLDSKVADVDLFKGIFDAGNGNHSFMNGVQTVLECLYYEVSENDCLTFMDMFMDNMGESIKKELKKENVEVLL